MGQTNVARNPGGQFRSGGKISQSHRGGVGGNHAAHTVTERDQSERSAQPRQSFDDQIDRETTKAVGALNVAAPAAQRNVEGRAYGKQHHQNRSGQIEVIGNLRLKHEEGERDRNACSPGAAFEAAIDRAFSFQRTLLRHHFGANDLERKRDRRD